MLGFAGPLYLAANAGLGRLVCWLGSLRVARERDSEREPQARRLFGISILYLFALFAALIVEQAAGHCAVHAVDRGMTGDDERKAETAKEAFERARRMRNFAIAGILVFLVVLFFLMTIVRLGGHVAD